MNIFEKKLEAYKSIKVQGNKSKFLLITFLGFLGIHKFIEKKYVVGIIYLFTFGIFGIGVIVDLINDYAEYEDDKKLDLVRYIISIIIIILAIINHNSSNFYYFIIAGILFMPIIYSKLLLLLPNIIKIIAIIVLCYFGFQKEVIKDTVPNNLIGIWKTDNEFTNFVSIKIKSDKSSIKFNDRDEQT